VGTLQNTIGTSLCLYVFFMEAIVLTCATWILCFTCQVSWRFNVAYTSCCV